MEFDHLVIVVPDLEIAALKFEKAGFSVSSGGRHFAGISENKLIFFEDGTFIELLKIRNSFGGWSLKFLYYSKLHHILRNLKRIGLPYRFYINAQHRKIGLYDFCFLADDLIYQESRLKEKNIGMSQIINAGRVRPDGNILKWKMSTPMVSYLPFLRDTFKADQLSTNANNTNHQNGVVGIKRIDCIIQNLTEKSADIISFYGAENCQINKHQIVVYTPKVQLIYKELGTSEKSKKEVPSTNEIDFTIEFNFAENVKSHQISSISEYINISQ